MHLNENETNVALNHVEKLTAMVDSLLPLLRSLKELDPAAVTGMEEISRSARGWLNQQRVTQTLESMRGGASADREPITRVHPGARTSESGPQLNKDAVAEPTVNPLEALGDLFKTLSPLAEALGKLSGLSRR